jgi:hypothetical protein
MMSDVDIAVPEQQRYAAEQTLDQLGYRVATRYPAGPQAVAEYVRAGAPAAVDLHVELIDQHYVLPAAEVFTRARKIVSNGVSFEVPESTERLLHVLLHAQIHHLGQYYCGRIDLGQLYDFCKIAGGAGRLAGARGGAVSGPRVDWNSIDCRLRRFGLCNVLDSYLSAANLLFGFEWPLERAPGRGARRQLLRWLLQLQIPTLSAIEIPMGNIAGAFAAHRMRALYGDDGGLLRGRIEHFRQFAQRHNARQVLARLKRGS